MNALTIRRIATLRMPADSLRELLVILADDAVTERHADRHEIRDASRDGDATTLTDAERARRYRAARKQRIEPENASQHERANECSVTETVTGRHVTRHATVTESVTESVTAVTESVTEPVTENQFHPPLSPTPPIPTREEAPAGTRIREAELFQTPEPQPKRIRWTPEDGWIGITAEDRARWASAFPACDIDRQLSSATNWLLANPREAKKSNFARFLNNWLSRSQERGGDARQQRYTNGNQHTGRNNGPPAPSSLESFRPGAKPPEGPIDPAMFLHGGNRTGS